MRSAVTIFNVYQIFIKRVKIVKMDFFLDNHTNTYLNSNEDGNKLIFAHTVSELIQKQTRSFR